MAFVVEMQGAGQGGIPGMVDGVGPSGGGGEGKGGGPGKRKREGGKKK